MTVLMFIVLWISEKVDPHMRILTPLSTMQVAHRVGDGFFVLDIGEKRVLRYDSDWKLLGHFGGPGEGPGEFKWPVRVFCWQDRVYVQGIGALHVFDGQGRFQQRFTFPRDVMFPYKVADGWIGLQGDLLGKELKCVKFSEDLTQSTLLLSWDVPVRNKNDALQQDSNLLVSTDGKRAFIRPRLSGDIWIYDNETGNAKVLTLNLAKIPYSESAKKKLLATRNRVRRKHGKPSLTLRFPDYHPDIMYIELTHTGKIMVTRSWDQIEDTMDAAFAAGRILFLDQKGEQVSPFELDFFPNRVLAIDGDWVFHAGYDSADGSYTVYRTERSGLKTAIRELSTDCTHCGSSK